MRIDGVRTAAPASGSRSLVASGSRSLVASGSRSLVASGSRSLVASGSVSLVACITLVTSGCGTGDDVITGIGLPPADSQSTGSSLQAIPQPSDAKSAMVVTPQQQSYLDGLAAAGVRPSSNLAALSIGSYVCQARAAHQSDQALWDFVMPTVRGDVRDMQQASSVALPVGEVTSVTADYIRIATEKLC